MKTKLKKIGIISGFLILGALIAFVALLMYLSFTFGVAVGEKRLNEYITSATGNVLNKRIPEENHSEVDFEPFWEAWAILEDKFVAFPDEEKKNNSEQKLNNEESGSDQKKVWSAIRGLASAYDDPYTVFFPPSENKIFESDVNGEFSGVGMEIGVRDGLLTVISPLPGTPASQSGIKPRDVILKIDETDSADMSPTEAVKLIRGPKGTDVKLAVAREGEASPIDITITRDLIQIPTIETEMVDDSFVIRLFSFTSKSPQLFRDALAEFANTESEKLVLDLRGNPGGYLQASVSIASWFLDDSKLVVKEDRGEGQGREYYSEGYDVFSDQLNMVVLIDEGSASASEILAGALSDHKVATLVGRPTFGKGSVQELIEITPETSLKVTIARWLTPSGSHISEEGIEPDILVENVEDASENSDLILEQAIEYLNNN